MKKLQKIISGGQTGVDQAALKAGLEQGFQIGGWCPPGRVSENGIISEVYPLIETADDRSQDAPDIKHSQRTKYNVRDSDATLILKPGGIRNDPGTNWTLACAKKYMRPCLVVDPYHPDAEKSVTEWLKRTSIEILNVAGPSENTSSGIGDLICSLLSHVFANLRKDIP